MNVVARRQRALRSMAMAVVVLPMTALPLHAQDAEAKSAPERDSATVASSWTFSIENDSFMPEGRGSDRRYTNGLHFIYDAPVEAGIWWRDLCRAELFCGGDRHDSTAAYLLRRRLVQTHHTPDVIERFEPVDGERPYAGLLYGEAELISILPLSLDGTSPWTIHRMTSFGFLTGVWGRLAGSEAAQAGFHTIQAHRDPKGWEATEDFGLALQVSHRNRVLFRLADMIAIEPEFEARLGDPMTELGGSFTFRIGNQLRPLAPSSVTAAFVPGPKAPRFRVEGLASFRTRRVFSNGFLERGSTNIAHEEVVNDFTWGLRLEAWRWALTYLQTRRSPELSDAVFRQEHDYGVLQLTRFLDGEAGDPISRLLRRFEVSGALGTGWVDLARAGRGGGDRHAMRILINYRLRDWLSLKLLDLSASGQFADSPGPGGTYTDRFLRSNASLQGVALRPFHSFTEGMRWLSGLELSFARAAGTRIDWLCDLGNEGDICARGVEKRISLGHGLQLGAYLGTGIGHGLFVGPDFTHTSFGDDDALTTVTLRASWRPV